jgi:DNA-directed RNA polymerase subunit RPC12/RpoP
MFAAITCPACQHKFSIPEGAMGKRQTCPNCHSPFLAGKSVAEAEVPMKFQAAAAAPINKTMLGEIEPPIKYNCPRCKKELEAPAIEAGTKKPCPSCGQRLQVPAAAAPPLGAPQAGLNKTILAADESKAEPIRYNCPNCKKPLESPPIEALSKKNCPACGQRFQIPAASTNGAPRPNLNKTVLASDESREQPSGAPAGAPASAPATTVSASQPTGQAPLFRRPLVIGGAVGGVVVVLLLLTCVLSIFIGSGDRKALADSQKELEALKAKLQKDQEAAERRMEQEKRDNEQRMADLKNRELINALIGNKQQKADADEKLQRDREEWDRRSRAQQQEHERAMAKIQADAAAAAAQAAAINAARPSWYRGGYWANGYWYPY